MPPVTPNTKVKALVVKRKDSLDDSLCFQRTSMVIKATSGWTRSLVARDLTGPRCSSLGNILGYWGLPSLPD